MSQCCWKLRFSIHLRLNSSFKGKKLVKHMIVMNVSDFSSGVLIVAWMILCEWWKWEALSKWGGVEGGREEHHMSRRERVGSEAITWKHFELRLLPEGPRFIRCGRGQCAHIFRSHVTSTGWECHYLWHAATININKFTKRERCCRTRIRMIQNHQCASSQKTHVITPNDCTEQGEKLKPSC